MAITHSKVSAVSDGGDTSLVRPSDWNDDHTITSSIVATDAIWDAAGDLAVGTGADTAAKLTKGAAGAALSIINSAVAWNSGTSFPGSAAAGDRYWRTDRGLEYYYDGTRWLCTCLHVEPIGAYNDSTEQPISTTPTVPMRNVIARDLYDIWVVDCRLTVRVNTTNSGSHYWTYQLENSPAGAVLGSTGNTSADSPDTIYRKVVTVGASVGDSGQRNVFVRFTKTGTPGTIDMVMAAWTWRFIG